MADLSEKDAKLLDDASNKYKVIETITKCVRSNYVCGGCLLYLDFGDEYDLEEPLDLKKVDLDDFKGFRHIDPINITAVDVNTIDPSKDDYMSPKIWYVIGLGAVHASHFLKYEDNIPELMMKPMCLYFGMPLTLLIKQDVANSNLASQGLANLMNRFRYLYLQTSDDNFTSSNAVDFRKRLETMSMIQDNFGIYPLKSTEQIQQFTASLTGMDKNAEFFYQIIASKTDITLSVLLGKGAQGLSGTLEGERKNWYDRVRSIQQQNKHNLLVMLGIVYGKEKDGKFVEFADYAFNPLEQSNEKEKAENLKSYTEVAKSLIEVGVKTEDILTWLKSFKDFHLENVELDDEVEDLENYDELIDSETQVENGGIGSGNFGHAGREGKVGGSSPTDSLGEEYKDVKGLEAINLIIKNKGGYVIDAFNRDDIGGISIAWGVAGRPNTEEGFGISHIIRRRTEQHKDVGKLFDSLDELFKKGELKTAKKGRLKIEYEGKRAIIDPKFYNGEIQLLLTAYYLD